MVGLEQRIACNFQGGPSLSLSLRLSSLFILARFSVASSHTLVFLCYTSRTHTPNVFYLSVSTLQVATLPASAKSRTLTLDPAVVTSGVMTVRYACARVRTNVCTCASSVR